MIGQEGELGQERGRATRREIIDVARCLFSEHGYYGTGIADIQLATGVTKGAFYHHFRTKEDVALAAIEAARADYASQWMGPAMEQTRPVDRLVASLDRVVQLNDQPQWRNCCMLATLMAEVSDGEARLRDAVSDLRTDAVQVWEKLIRQGQEAGQVRRAVEARVAAEWIVSTIVGSLLARKVGAPAGQTRQVMEVLKGALLTKAGQKRASALA